VDELAPEWNAQVFGAIERATVLLFLMSPDSLESSLCVLELDFAFQAEKRVIPIVVRDVDTAYIPDALRSLPWVFLHDTDDLERELPALMSRF
jgi:hypothetical protein